MTKSLTFAETIESLVGSVSNFIPSKDGGDYLPRPSIENEAKTAFYDKVCNNIGDKRIEHDGQVYFVKSSQGSTNFGTLWLKREKIVNFDEVELAW